jgi:hypothetical protein
LAGGLNADQLRIEQKDDIIVIALTVKAITIYYGRGVAMAFYGRTRELALLDQMYSKSDARMFLLYGRRRVGKTELLRHWVQSRKYPTLYWQAELFPSKIQLSQFHFWFLGTSLPRNWSTGTSRSPGRRVG